MRILFWSFLLITFVACGQSMENPTEQPLPAISYEELLEKVNQDNETLYVVNFWATWCLPCVEEMPDFLAIHKEFEDHPHFKMYLVTLDSAKKSAVVQQFIKTNQVEPEVLILDDNKRMNTWIPIIHPEWSGAIPATAFYQNGKQVDFVDESLHQEDLRNIIKKYIQ